MRPIHMAELDKPRPVLVRARNLVRKETTRITIPKITLGRQIGYFLPGQEAALTAAIRAAFDLG
jgi:mRNA interferase MazF